MSEPAPTGARTGRLVLLAALFGVAAVNVADSIPEGGMNSWTSIPAWAVLAAVASLVTLAPFAPRLSATARGSAWRLAAAGAVSLWFLWVLFVLPGIYRNVAFLFTLGAAASTWAVWNAPGRPARTPPSP